MLCYFAHTDVIEQVSLVTIRVNNDSPCGTLNFFMK